MDLSVSSSSWCLGRAAVCDCDTPWTFLLPLFFFFFFFYSTDRSKSVVPVLVLLFVALWFSLTSYQFVLVFFSPFSIAITSLGEERAYLSAFRTFV